MLMVVLGWVLIAVASGWFAYKMYISYTSAGGTDFAMPVYDAAIYPPILAGVGLYFVLPPLGIQWPFWAFVVIALGLAVLFGVSIRIMEEVGDKEL
jgi:hypothetical protein